MSAGPTVLKIDPTPIPLSGATTGGGTNAVRMTRPGISATMLAKAGVFPFPNDNELPAPSDLSAGAAENFPIQSFPLLLRAVAENMAAVYQTPISLPAMSALAVLSGAVGKSAVVCAGYKDKATRLNLYVIAVAERGSGKGVIGETLCAPINQESRELAKRHALVMAGKRGELGVLKKEVQRLEQQAAGADGHERANLVSTLENRHARLAELDAESAREVSLIIGDTTSEALGRALADNGETLFAFSSEAGAAVKVALGKYSDQGDFDLLLSGYSGDSVRTLRIGRKSVQLENPCLALLWLIQPIVICQLVGDPEAFARGLTARPLIFDTAAVREKDDRRNLAFTEAENWQSFLSLILTRRLAGDTPIEIRCSPEAREVFAKFDDETVDLGRGPFADLAGELSRWRENAIKVAGLFAVAENTTSISVDLAARAVSVVRWVGYNYLSLLQSGRRERLRERLDRALEILREHGGEVNLGVLDRKHGMKRPEVESLIAVFPAHLEIRRIPQQGAGRPAELLKAVTKSSKST